MKQIKNRMKMKRIMIMIQTAKSKAFPRIFCFAETLETQIKAA